MPDKLAIVIPAFKIKFFNEALESIARQTNKNFTLYIGDDNSPVDLESVVQKYMGLIDIHYKKFADNWGSVSLVKQWERCINMIGNEEWIWLFSDDDMMDNGCVQSFYEELGAGNDYNVFRFNLNIIDASGTEKRRTIYPVIETASDFILSRLKLKYDSAITNYILCRKKFNELGFIDFPLAWASDDASIANLAGTKPIKTIPGIFVKWRISDINISSVTSNLDFQKEKVYSRLKYIQWIYDSNKFPELLNKKNKFHAMGWILGSINTEYKEFSNEEKKILYSKVEKSIQEKIYVYKFNSWKKRKMRYIILLINVLSRKLYLKKYSRRDLNRGGL